MGSHPRREKAEREVRERAASSRRSIARLAVRSPRAPGFDIAAIDSSARHAISRIHKACSDGAARAPGASRHLSSVIQRSGYTVQAMADDYRTSLGPFVPVQSAETLRRLLAYLGAAPAQVADFDCVVADVGKALSGSRFSRSARTCCASVIGRICENPPGWRRMVPCAWLQPREIYVNFIPSNGYSVQAMDLDCRTILGPLRDDAERRDTAPPAGLPWRRARATRRLRPQHPQLGPGTARITLEAGRKNLLRLRA
jgi:hypothetical protein